jgi:hypothetical protein
MRLTTRGKILIAILLLPIFVYAYTFGLTLSRNHERWAEFGSAMSGIYSPILAIFTLVVLLNQYRLQKLLTDHQQNHTQIERNIADLEFFSVRLEAYLAQDAGPYGRVYNLIRTEFQPNSLELLNSTECTNKAALCNQEYPHIASTWGAVYPVLMSLEAIDKGIGQAAFQTCKQKLILILTFETCVALDNYYHAVTKGKLSINYKFSPLFDYVWRAS